MKSVVKVIVVDVYQTSVCYCIGINEKELKELKDNSSNKFNDEIYNDCLKDITDKDSCDGFAATMLDGTQLMYIRKGFEKDWRIISHEIFHVANKILCDRGVTHDESGEAWAYLIGYLSDEYNKIIKGK